MLKHLIRPRLRPRRASPAREAAFFLRGCLFAGTRFHCPCCGWSLRSFTGRGTLIASSADGYCPRCNAKARHRRLWLFLAERTDLFERKSTAVLEVAPWWAFARRLRRMPVIRYVSIDLAGQEAGADVLGDVARLPFADASFDALLCIHVLEHVTEDRAAIGELFRVLRPGGWAVVSVPIRLDQPTVEDAAVTAPADRLRLFGEAGHVRYYGADFAARLAAAGFRVTMDPAAAVPADVRRRYGLRDDENVFFCLRPPVGAQP